MAPGRFFNFLYTSEICSLKYISADERPVKRPDAQSLVLEAGPLGHAVSNVAGAKPAGQCHPDHVLGTAGPKLRGPLLFARS